MTNEIVLYQPNDQLALEVRLENETVWLNRNQMAMLFDRDVKTIGKHINNALNEELTPTVAKFATTQTGTSTIALNVAPQNEPAVVAKFATTAADGKTYQVEYYNLDVILSVGYRVKSTQGIMFRRWANKVLREYLLRGYSVNQRLTHLEQRIDNRLQEHTEQIHDLQNKVDFFVRTSLPPSEGIFYDGQIFDAYLFVNDRIREAKERIILIDNYVDDSVLAMLDKRNGSVKATIYTKNISQQLSLDFEKHNAQYAPIEVVQFDRSHDRFLCIDETVYHLGASLKDLGKKWFAFNRMELTTTELTEKM